MAAAAAASSNSKQQQTAPQSQSQKAALSSLSCSSNLSCGPVAGESSASAGTSQRTQQSQVAKPAAQQQKISSPNLLSPNVAIEQGGGGGGGKSSPGGCRRKSTLSANGFFIDYSCTRRRSSAAQQQQQARAQSSLDPLAKSQFLRQVISPTGAGAGLRRPSTMVAGSLSSAQARESFSAPSASSGRVNSRASYSSGHHHLLRPPPPTGHNRHNMQRQSMSGGVGLLGLPSGGAARSLAGSRKTSIFDPVGHSLVAPAGDPRHRRKSTMVASGVPPALEQAATMLAFSRQAAALRRDRAQGSAKSRLAERVPVIGCSPTSIGASLRALEETRRYEKLLRKLDDHQARRARERRKLEQRAEEDELMCDINLESYGESESDDDDDMTSSSSNGGGGDDNEEPDSSDANSHDNDNQQQQQQQQTVSALLRRKSQRALHDVGVLLNRVAQAQRKRRRRRKRRWRLSGSSAGAWRKSHGAGDPFIDGLSISSTLSFMSSQTSLHSMGRFLDGLSLGPTTSGYAEHGDGGGGGGSSSSSSGSGSGSGEDEEDGESEYENDDDDDDDDEGAHVAHVACHSEGHLAHYDGNRELRQGRRGETHEGHAGQSSHGRHRPGGNRRYRSDGGRPPAEMTLGSALDLSSVGNNNEPGDGGQRRLYHQRRTTSGGLGGSASGRQQQQQQPPTKSSLVGRAMRSIAAALANNSKQGKSERASSRDGRQANQHDATGPLQTANKTTTTLAATSSSTTTTITTTPAGYKDNELAQQLAGSENNGQRRTTSRHRSGGNKRAGRRRSVSMSAGLNYWHYYYYLRNNSLDDLPGAYEMVAGGGGGSGCGAASASALYGRPSLAAGLDYHHQLQQQIPGDHHHGAACGGVGTVAGPLLVGAGGSPMSDSERRTRLYVNYSLARLDITNCRTDPVARLAAKLEQQATAAHQQAERGEEEEQQQDEQIQWAATALTNDDAQPNCFEFTQSSDSDVSLSLSTSSTDLNSSDTSRNSSSLSSRVASTTSAECSLAGLATAAATAVEGQKTNRRAGPLSSSKGHQVAPPYRREASLSSSVLSDSSRTSLATVKSRHQLEPAMALNGRERATSGPDEPLSPWQGQPPSSADWQANVRQQQQHQHQMQQRPRGCSATPTGPRRAEGIGWAASARSGGGGGHLARDSHFRFSVKSTRSSVSSSASASAWSSRQSSAESARPATSGGSQVPMGHHGPPSFPPGSPSPHHPPAPHHQLANPQPPHGRANNQSSVQWQQQQQQQQPLRQFVSSGGLSPPSAQDRRRSRTFLSWDRLEMTDVQQQQQLRHAPIATNPASQRPLQAIRSGLAASTHAGETPERRPLASGRLLSGHLGGSSESTSTLEGGGGGRSTLAACRRSFKQLRGAGRATQQPAATSSPVGTRRWCSSSIVSRSKSFLFQRRVSTKRAGPGDPQRGSNPESGPSDKQPKRPMVVQRRDEQREAADKLLEQFEAQMSEAANLAHEKQQQQQQKQQVERDCNYQMRSHSNQPQQTGECKSGRLQSPRRSTVSSSPASSLESSASASEQRRDAQNQRRQQQLQVQPNETQTMRKSALCLAGATGDGASAVGAAASSQQLSANATRPLQARARSSISLLGGSGGGSCETTAAHSCLSSHRAHQQQQQPQQFAMLQVANQQHDNNNHHHRRRLTSGEGGANDSPVAAAISACPSPTHSSLNPASAQGQPLQLGRFTSDISLQQGAFQQQQADMHWHNQPPGELSRQSCSTSGSSRTNTNQNSFESAAGQTTTSGSGERLYGAPEDLSTTSGGRLGTPADGVRARAHSTGAGCAPSACLFANELPIGGDGGLHPGPQQPLHANSMQALARRTSREVRDQQQKQQLRALSNESGRHSDSHVAAAVQRPVSPTGSMAGGADSRSAAFVLQQNYQQQQLDETTRQDNARTGHEVSGDGCGASLHAQAVSVLRKSSFTCTVLGARQTGKRTIVICFVKLLNEFKLAADECKKEAMLTKLVECSERLQELASRAEHDQEQQEVERRSREVEDEMLRGGAGHRQRRTSRLNSWLPSSGAVRHLLNLSPVGAKRRLHSIVSPLLGATNQQQDHQELSQRRHTTFEPASSQQQLQQQQSAGIQSSSSSRLLSVHTGAAGGGDDNLLLSSCQNANKSDTNISYQTTQFGGEQPVERTNSGGSGSAGGERPPHQRSGHQLQVPSLDAAMLRKHSDPTGCRGAQQQQLKLEQQQRMATQSPGSVFLHSTAEHGSQGASPKHLANQRRRHTTLVASTGAGLMDTRASGNNEVRMSRGSAKRVVGGKSPSPQPNNYRPRRPTICLSRRKRRVLLSLKELNRRKFAIKFNTRRQISESLVAQISANAERQRAAAASARGRRRSTILQLTGGSTPGQHTDSLVLPDSFLVIYSINDRDSFEYAKSLVEQLRLLASQQVQEIPLPIVLVANKSDLERNREVKASDGRAVAKRYACKFIEISCTIGFNLDNLLVGLRTQLVLKHHIVLNSILRPGFRYKARYLQAVATRQRQNDNDTSDRAGGQTAGQRAAAKRQQEANNRDKRTTNKMASDNILIRLYKRYVMDNNGNDYDCDNFSKL